MVFSAESGLDRLPYAALDAEGRLRRLACADVFLPAAQRFHRLVGGTEIAALDAEAEEVAPQGTRFAERFGYLQHGRQGIVGKDHRSLVQDEEPLRHRACRLAHQRALAIERLAGGLHFPVTLADRGNVRSEKASVGKESASTGKTRGSPD